MRAPGLAVLFLAGAVAAGAQTVGSQPGQVFTVGASGRALGMGSAFTAVAGDASALYYNPAGLGLLAGRRAEALHAALYGGASFDYVGYAQNLPRVEGGWGVEVLRLGVGGIEARDAADNASGTFGYSELGFGAGFGLADFLIDDLALGAGIKTDERSLAGESNRLTGVDAGAQYGPFFHDRATVGLSLQNAVSLASGGTDDRLAPAARLGAAFRVADPLLLAVDASNAGDFRAGAEYRAGIFALRAGWTSGGPTFGGGVLFQEKLSFDVAVLASPALGVSERISLGYRFGAYRTAGPASSLALDRLIQALGVLRKREYSEAGRLLDEAVAEEPSVGRRPLIEGGDWRRKDARLRRLLDALGLDARPEDQEDLRAPTVAADLTERAIRSLIDGSLDDAVLLAQVAAGEGPRGSVFARLPQAMARAAGRAPSRDAVMPVAAFVSDRINRMNDALYDRRYAAAIEACRQNALVQPDSAPAWERLGLAYFKAGEREKAAAAYSKSLALDPSNQTLLDFIRAHFKR